VTRQEFLESKGWVVERIWSRNWWRDSNKEVDRIHKKIQELRKIKPKDDLITDSSSTFIQLTTGDQKDKQCSTVEQKFEQLIKKGESDTLEFKSSLIWDYEQNKPNKLLRNSILKTVAAYMNSEGGLLIVGVADNGEILGLDKDFEALDKKKSWDEWMQHFINMFNENIGKAFISFVKVKDIRYNGKPLAIVEVKRNDLGPIYLDPKGKSEFYIRAGTTSQPLNTKEAVAYTKQHWHL
jgi:schlafen family protein